MLIIYNLLLIIAIVLLLPLVIFKILSNKNLKINLKDRLTLYPSEFKSKIKNKKIIWIHASSVGEVNVANILIKNFKNFSQDYSILLTTMTYTGFINGVNSKLYDFVKVVPFDISFFVKRFLKIVKPKIILITETEFWPNIFYFSNKNKIPIIVYNCRISDKSFKNYLKFKFFFSNILNCVSVFICQNKITIDRLRKLGVNEFKLKLSGNIKFDISLKNYDKKQVFEEFGIEESNKFFIFTAGSTHDPEEKKILSIIEKIDNMFFILAPRHVNRIPEITKIIEEKNFSYNLLSNRNKNKNAKILLIDKIGYLTKAYSISDACFIGGSLSFNGGHNPLEAIFFKKPVISGKNIYNFTEIYSQLKENDGVILVENEFELLKAIKKLQIDKEFYKKISKNGYMVLEKNKGASSIVINEILKLLNKE